MLCLMWVWNCFIMCFSMFPVHVLKITNFAGISWLKLPVRPGGFSD
jgi:hypothetical protein